jgi:hypothetical protein
MAGYKPTGTPGARISRTTITGTQGSCFSAGCGNSIPNQKDGISPVGDQHTTNTCGPEQMNTQSAGSFAPQTSDEFAKFAKSRKGTAKSGRKPKNQLSQTCDLYHKVKHFPPGSMKSAT